MGVVTDMKRSQPQSYTLAEIKALMAQWISEQEGDTEILKWTMSIFIEWLAKREKELRR